MADPRPDQKTEQLIRDVVALRRKHNALVAVIVTDDTVAFDYRGGISGEEFRHELITAANHVRNDVNKKAGR